MTSIVSLHEASEHLRRDMDDCDSLDLQTKIDAASAAVMQYLEWDELPEPVPPLVKAATLNLVGQMYRERDGELSGRIQWGYGYLPVGVVALLYPLRRPSLA